MFRTCLQRLVRRHSLFFLQPKQRFHHGKLQVSAEVASALKNGQPVVALESTIISHGMPYPQNLRTAQQVEQIIRKNRCVPATIAIIKGIVHVGLEEKQLEQLAHPSFKCTKTSRRDLPYVLAQNLNGGTTVSATMLLAHKAGIPIFVTGGIGGVHRGAESTMDISSDLTELGRTPVTVISAGVKSILDIGRTLEFLETQGVCVASFGPTTDFPAFFTPKSGFHAPMNVKDPLEAAQLIAAHHKLALESGVLIGVPLSDRFASLGETIETAIKMAVAEAEEQSIRGKDITPFILQRVAELTKGVSLESNIALILNNANVGSQIALELSNLQQQTRETTHTVLNSEIKEKVVVIGGALHDFYVRLEDEYKLETDGRMIPGSCSQSFGGVGFNIANCLGKLGVPTSFVSAVGQDPTGTQFLKSYNHLDLSGVMQIPGRLTASYCGFLQPHGHLIFGVGNSEILESISVQQIHSMENYIKNAPLVCVDANLNSDAILTLCELCQKHGVPVWFEPTDHVKASKFFLWPVGSMFTYISPNESEFRAIHHAITGTTTESLLDADLSQKENVDAILKQCATMCRDLISFVPVIILTLGKLGVLIAHCDKTGTHLPLKGSKIFKRPEDMVAKFFPVYGLENVLSVSGSGDCFAAGLLAGILHGHPLDLSIKLGLMTANLSLLSTETVPDTIKPVCCTPLHIAQSYKAPPPRMIDL